MTHLGERITDFMFGELSETEMEEARRHVAACADCGRRVEQFERTRAMLKMSPDIEPPRRIVFEVENPKVANLWRWLAPIGVAAAIVMAVLVASPMQVQWHDSQLTIAFGSAPAVPPSRTVAPVPTVQQAVQQPIDYDRVIREVQNSDQAWLLSQFKARDSEQAKEIHRLQSQLEFLDNLQRSMYKETLENSTSIQLLAQVKSDSRD